MKPSRRFLRHTSQETKARLLVFSDNQPAQHAEYCGETNA